MKFDIEVDGVAQTLHAFEKVERGVVDMRELGTWDWVQTEFYKVVGKIFDTEGGAGASGKWQELSQPYSDQKRGRYGDMPILQASGDMRKSLTESGGSAVAEKKPDEIVLGSRDPKSAWHNRGAGRNPARKIFDFTDEHKQQITAPISKKLKQLIDNAKLRDIRGV